MSKVNASNRLVETDTLRLGANVRLLMTLRPLNVSFSAKWSSNDTWSEAYVGVRQLIYDILPKTIGEQRVEDSVLCQLALIGANHLVEVAIGQVLRPLAEKEPERLTAENLEKAGYFEMLTQWLPKMAGTSLDLKTQPFLSSEALRKRRNETVHKTSALATAPMARSALFSAVEACRSIYEHSGQKFPYAEVLKADPIPQEEWFSNVHMPPAI